MYECGERIKNMAIIALFGENLIPKLVSLKHRIISVSFFEY